MPRLLGLALAIAAPAFGQPPLVEGDPSSPVRVVIFEDLQCPDCADFRVMLDQEILPRFKTSVAFEHRDFPLPKHDWARKAAIAARYFQGISPELGAEFRQSTMRAQKHLTAAALEAHVADFARSRKLDPSKAVAALADPALAERVEADYQYAVARGIARTPTVLVNGEPFLERFPAAEVIRAIERELAAARK
jgi:protein-disulfide isomerase